MDLNTITRMMICILVVTNFIILLILSKFMTAYPRIKQADFSIIPSGSDKTISAAPGIKQADYTTIPPGLDKTISAAPRIEQADSPNIPPGLDKTISAALRIKQADSPKEMKTDPITDLSKRHTIPLGLDETISREGNDVTFVRAMVVYYPGDSNNANFYMKQLKWLHASWKLMLETQPKEWRTDLIITLIKNETFCDTLNCTSHVRMNPEEADTCKCHTGYNPKIPDFGDYDVANSMNVLLFLQLESYDWVIRSDLDTFLTPGFSKWRPKNMVVGGGGYIQGADLITHHRLQRVAQNLNLLDKGLKNVGSTWYGPTRLILFAANLTMSSMRYLKKWEFTKLERSPKFGVQGWPEWHYGVLLLYGGHLAINHIATQYNISVEPTLLDYGTGNEELVDNHPHLHTWHGNGDFSKFKFKLGKYKDVEVKTLNMSVCKDYAMYLALTANR